MSSLPEIPKFALSLSKFTQFTSRIKSSFDISHATPAEGNGNNPGTFTPKRVDASKALCKLKK